MSVNTYPVVQEAAFLIDAEVAAYITLALDKKGNSVPDAIAALSQDEFREMARAGTLPEDYVDVEIAENINEVCFVSSFDGEITTLFSEKTANPISETCEDDYWHYIPSQRGSDLFSAAYSSPDELLNEFKEIFTTKGVELPGDFDWWKHIVKIIVTTYC